MPEAPQERIITRRELVYEKTCPECGTTFLGLSRQVYHDNDCAQRAAYKRNAEKRRAEARERYQRQKARN
jgi:hypothetical protein